MVTPDARASWPVDPWDAGAFAGASGAAWELVPESAEGAPAVMYAAECLLCPAECRMDGNPHPVTAFTIFHTGEAPDHCQYLLTMQRHGRIIPRTEDAPVPATAYYPGRGRGARGHARPASFASRWLAAVGCRVVARLGAFAGWLYLLALVSACVAVGALIGTAFAS